LGKEKSIATSTGAQPAAASVRFGALSISVADEENPHKAEIEE
jgi:hypothetical protein